MTWQFLALFFAWYIGALLMAFYISSDEGKISGDFWMLIFAIIFWPPFLLIKLIAVSLENPDK